MLIDWRALEPLEDEQKRPRVNASDVSGSKLCSSYGRTFSISLSIACDLFKLSSGICTLSKPGEAKELQV